MDKLDKKMIGERIKLIRKSRGENQTDFAKKVSATLPAVSNWETGRNVPNNERIKKIAELGNISVDELLYGTKQEVARKAIDDAFEEYISTSSEYYHDYMDHQERYNKIRNDLYKEYMDVDSIFAFSLDDPYSFLKDGIYGVFEKEFLRSERTNEDMIDYFKSLIVQAQSDIYEYQHDSLTQEAIKNNDIDEDMIYELIDKLDDILRYIDNIKN